MNFKKQIWSQFILTGIQVLFFTLLFRHIGSLYIKLIETPSLNNLTLEKVDSIEESIKTNLQNTNLKTSLYRYFVFFYIEDYSSRQYFISSNEESPAVRNAAKNVSKILSRH